MAKKKQKSPYGKFSVEDVEQAEADAFYIQIGHELFSEGEYYAFSKDRVDHFYKQILAGLRDIIKNGSKEEKDETIRALWNFRVVPLRIQ